MKRLPPALILPSLLLSAASAGMWVRSQFVDDAWEFAPRPLDGPGWQRRDEPGWHRRVVGSTRGRLVFVAFEADAPPARTGYLPPELVPAGMLHRSTYQTLVYRFMTDGGWGRVPIKHLFLPVPWPLLVVVFAIPPAARVWSRWRRERQPAFRVDLHRD